jgi:hypothetical protein
MTGSTTSKTSMIIDGIAASEAIDSSGEILDVKGCDITSFETGVGLLNYEHRGDKIPGASGLDIVGKIVYAKKIFKKDDCEDKRQEAYWDSVKLPFIYIKGRLYDGSDHEGAKALAAAIRDAVTHNEPVLARFSIEGSTLKKEGQRLARTIAQKVAITFKPANKSASSGMISDPQGKTPITEKQAEKTLLSQLLDEDTIKSDIPGEQRLGGYTADARGMEVKEDPAELLKSAIDGLKALLKTTTGGSGEGAPSGRINSDALAREDDRLHRGRGQLKQDLRAAVRDRPLSARIDKGEMLKFFKAKLPDVDASFLEHFTDLVDDIRTRQVGDWVEKTMGVWDAVKKAEKRGAGEALGAVEPKEPEAPPVPEKPEYTPRPENTNPAVVDPPTSRGMGMSAEGELLSHKLTTEKASLKLYDYSKDPVFMEVLHADDAEKSPSLDAGTRARIIKYVHTPWQRAAASWLVLNRMAQAGELPASVIAHAAIFAAMSPNTSVPMQELYFGHYMDFNKKYPDAFLNPKGVDPKDAEHFHKWLNKNTPPEFFKEFYLQNTPEKGGIAFGAGKKQSLIPGATLERRPQGAPLLNYHRFHPLMTSLLKEIKDDGRAYSDYLMQYKEEHGATSMMQGFGPKLARYQSLLMGQGNVVVPDRHFVRALFNLPEDHPHLGYLFNSLTPTHGERLLRGIDHHFNQNAPGVQKTVETYPEHFEGRRMQANALGFWLQWLCMPHYNALRGNPGDALNMGTAHDPYFKAVHDILDQEGIPHDMKDPSGLYLGKSEFIGRQFAAPLPARVAAATHRINDEFGENASAIFFHSFGVPALLAHERMNSVDEMQVRKMESMAVEIRSLAKALGEQGQEVQQALAPEEWPPANQSEVPFQGQAVKPGFATLYHDLNGDRVESGRKMAILGRTPAAENAPQGHWLMVPHEKLGQHRPEDLEKWAADGSAEVHQEPAFSDSKPGVVHSALHVPPHYAMKDYQKKMVHGLDMGVNSPVGTEPEHFQPGGGYGDWKTLPNGKMAYVKDHNDGPSGMQSSAHAEAFYHNAMHHLGLGDYVTPTTLFQDPNVPAHKDVTQGDWKSANEAVSNPSHYEGSQTQMDALHTLYKTGELDKLGLANQLLGNTDRHALNYLFGGKKGDQLYMIDHGHTMPGNHFEYETYPSYMHEAERLANVPSWAVSNVPQGLNKTLHPEAKKWLENVDPDKFEEFMGKHQVPASVAYAAINRLKAMQEYSKEEPDATFDEVHGWPNEYHGLGSETFRNAGEARGKVDSNFGGRHEQRVEKAKGARATRAEQWLGHQKAMHKVLARYVEAKATGKDPHPFSLLREELGEEEAKKAIMGEAGPAEAEQAIRKFNHGIRLRASSHKKPKD